MLVPLKWLKDYIALDKSPEEIAALLNMHILEVEKLSQPGKEIQRVIVAEIKEVNRHPNADKLSLLKVFTGKEMLSVVCGASNVAVNKKVALGLVGAKLPGGVELKQAKIRGIESQGMCCSERELGLAEESAGIIHLPDDAPLGEDIVKYLGLDEVIFDLAILPNRGDCQALQAIAIELHAATGAKLTLPTIKQAKPGKTKKANIVIQDPELCGRYMGCILDNIKIKTSPEWLQQKLKSVGLRPINNVVDITNFVLYEMGQPLHSFDYSRLKGGQIIVRRAKSDEEFTALDAKTIKLNPEMLVIADAEKPVALAGIMGGLNSGVTEETTTILLESAFFNPVSIRRTSRATAMRTDSSQRFEKSVSYDGVEQAFYRAIQLFQELASGEVVSNIVDLDPGRPTPVVINFEPGLVNKLLGTKLSSAKILTILERLQFKISKSKSKTKTKTKVTVPAARVHDITRPIDLVEEIARHVGYENIPSELPVLQNKNRSENEKKSKVIELISGQLLGAGFSEAISYSMTAPDIYQKLGLSQGFQGEQILANPLSQEESVLRQSLLPGLLQALRHNLDQQVTNVALFEQGKVFLATGEKNYFSGVVYGSIESGVLSKASQRDVDFYDLKGIMENIFNLLGIDFKKIECSNSPFLHPGKALEIKPYLIMGELHPAVREKIGLLKSAYLFELDLDVLVERARFVRKLSELPQYPAARRDIAFRIAKSIASEEISRVIQQSAGALVEEIQLFDYYAGEHIPAGKVSLAYAITYRSRERTLTDAEINAAHERIAKALVEKLKVEFQ